MADPIIALPDPGGFSLIFYRGLCDLQFSKNPHFGYPAAQQSTLLTVMGLFKFLVKGFYILKVLGWSTYMSPSLLGLKEIYEGCWVEQFMLQRFL